MKELSIEQKAKAYDEAYARMSRAYNDNRCSIGFMNEIFPRPKENEDERIRNGLIGYFRAGKCENISSYHGISTNDILAWLEKQGKSDETKSKMFLINKGYPIDANGKFPTYEEMYDIIKKGLENQGEQPQGKSALEAIEEEKVDNQNCVKPVDKIEPKFKVGDTVTVKPMSCHGKVFKGEPFKIVDIIEDNYVSDDGKTYSISLQDGWELVQQNPAWSEDDEQYI